MANINVLINKIADLPSPPVVVQRLQARMAEQDISNREVAEIIETDQAFTARVLRLVNSPFYGFPRKIISVEESITMLGFNTIHQLLLTTSLVKSFDINSQALNLNMFWEHSFGVGVVAKELLHKSNKDLRNEGFMCGILHDIGRLVLVKIDPEKYVAFHSKGQMATDLEAETEYFGMNHQKVGELIARKWNFPESIVAAISHHHNPQVESKYGLLISAVNIADMLTHALSIGNSGSHYITEFSKPAWQILDIDDKKLEALLKKSLAEIEKATDTLHSIQE
jgi:putative nucleotidyltransferase with HDIG domain